MGRINEVLKAAGLLLGLLAVGGSAALAQVESAAVEPCETTLGPEGHLLPAIYSLVHSPVPFVSARTAYTGVSIIPERLWVEQAIFALGTRVPPADATGQEGTYALDNRLIEFLDAGGLVVHQCIIETVAYNAEKYPLARLQHGNCNLTRVAGLPQLVAGHSQVWQFPEEASEAGIESTRIADISMISSETFYLLGKSPGVVVLVWSDQSADSPSINLCSFEVFSTDEALGADGIDENVMCVGEDGMPMRLSAGETARLPFRDPAGGAVEEPEAIVGSSMVAEASYDAQNKNVVISGVAPGTTSVTLFRWDKRSHAVHLHCEVVVE